MEAVSFSEIFFPDIPFYIVSYPIRPLLYITALNTAKYIH